MSYDVSQRLRFCTSQAYINHCGDDAHQRSMQDKARSNSTAHPERSHEARHKRSGRSSVMQEGFAEPQAERNNGQNKDDFSERASDQRFFPSAFASCSLATPALPMRLP